MLYHVFMLLWGINFIEGFAIMTVAGTVCGWYFTGEDDIGRRKQKDKFPVLASMYRTLRYHLGSIAFGSFLIAAVQMARLALEYLDSQTKKAQEKSRLVRILMKCFKCCLACFERCVKYLTRNAYIFVAFRGHSFFGAAKEVFFLIKENMAQMGVVGVISHYLMILGKFLLMGISTVICYFWLEYDKNYDTVTTLFTPIITEALVAFVIASVFLQVYSVAIDTILICYCEDIKLNDGSKEKPYYGGIYLLKRGGKYSKGTMRAHVDDDGESVAQEDEEDDYNDYDDKADGISKAQSTSSDLI